MDKISSHIRVLAAFVVLGALAGCADLTPPPQTASAAPESAGPETLELAGAWYQIYFDTNSATINGRGQTIIKTVAYVVANIKDSAPPRVTVVGRTDRVGAPPANVALSHRRANAVRDALIAAGVPTAHIDTSWTGELKQAVKTGDDFAESRNRVVDITVVKVPQRL